MRSLVALVAVCSLAAAPLAAKPQLTASKHRKVKQGVGNCIFSTQALPFEKESEYRDVKTAFQAGDVVHARCYFADKLAGFTKKGKLMNELRDEKTYRVTLVAREKLAKRRGKKAAGAELPTNIVRVKQDGEDEWDQREYELDPASKRCLFKSHLGTTGCLDFERATQELALLAGKKEGAFTAEYCIATTIEYADKQKGQAGSSVVEPIRESRTITEGCFEWTTTVVPPPPPPPAPPPNP